MSVPPDEVLRRLGAGMREIDPTTLQSTPEEGALRWFLGESGTELFAWTRQGPEPEQLQLTFARMQLEWTQERGLSTRRFRPGGSTAGGRYDAYLLGPPEERDPAICAAARVLLASSPVPDDVRAPLMRALQAAE